jgi:hypothetical protein
MSRRRAIRWALVGAAAIASCIAVGWVVLSRQVEAQVAAWAEARRAEGYTLAWSRLDIGGFPLRFTVTLAEARIAKDGWSAEAPAFSVDLAPWRPGRIDFAAPSLAASGPGGALALETVAAALELDGGRASRLAIDGTGAIARLGAEELGRADKARLVIDRFAPEAADWRTESLAGQAAVWGAKPPARFAGRLLFDDPFDLDLTGTIKGPLAGLERWRDAGGTVELERVIFAWGPLKATGNATVSLDGEMRPLGAGTASIQGVDPTLERLAARGQVKPSDAAIAKMVLGLMSKPNAEGASEVTVPVTAQDGRLFLGPVAILTLPRLAE